MPSCRFKLVPVECEGWRVRSRDRRPAFTLVEVLVGVTLMATMLVGSLLAFAAHRKQQRFADQKLRAVALADSLLDQLSHRPGGIPSTGRGPVASSPGWYWQTSPVRAIAPSRIPLTVIRFEIVGRSPDGSAKSLVNVELVRPLETGR